MEPAPRPRPAPAPSAPSRQHLNNCSNPMIAKPPFYRPVARRAPMHTKENVTKRLYEQLGPALNSYTPLSLISECELNGAPQQPYNRAVAAVANQGDKKAIKRQ